MELSLNTYIPLTHYLLTYFQSDGHKIIRGHGSSGRLHGSSYREDKCWQQLSGQLGAEGLSAGKAELHGVTRPLGPQRVCAAAAVVVVDDDDVVAVLHNGGSCRWQKLTSTETPQGRRSQWLINTKGKLTIGK